MSRRLLGVAAGALLAVVVAGYGLSGALRVRAMQREIAAVEREIARLHVESQRLAATIERLRHDPDYLEKLAREEHGMVREGETVLKFSPRPR